MGPIGGGLGFGASPWAGAGGAAAAASSAALTISLELFLEENVNIETLEAEFVVTEGVNTNPDAADAMLQLAIATSLSLVVLRVAKNIVAKERTRSVIKRLPVPMNSTSLVN